MMARGSVAAKRSRGRAKRGHQRSVRATRLRAAKRAMRKIGPETHIRDPLSEIPPGGVVPEPPAPVGPIGLGERVR